MKTILLIVAALSSACVLPSHSNIPTREHSCADGARPVEYPDGRRYGYNVTRTCSDGIYFADDIGFVERVRVMLTRWELQAQMPDVEMQCTLRGVLETDDSYSRTLSYGASGGYGPTSKCGEHWMLTQSFDVCTGEPIGELHPTQAEADDWCDRKPAE